VDVAGGGDFDGKPITLSVPRADHGAVAMSTGETLLVGGIGADGGTLRSLEIVQPGSSHGLTTGLAQLEQARSKPTVLRLASGEIMVAGGLQENGQPADHVEFFAQDARAVTRKSEVYRPGRETAFVPLSAGGALMVNADEGTPGLNTVYVVSAAGVLEPTPANLAGTVDHVRLFPGANGAPVLWTGSRWLQWQPWTGIFAPFVDALSAQGPSEASIASPDLGLAMWLSDDGAHLEGIRFAARGPYVAVPHPMLVDGVTGLSPDLLIDSRRNDEQRLRFDKTTGLTLDSGASAFVVDATFEDFTLEAELPNGAAPLVVLRDLGGVELEIGGPQCPIDVPAGASTQLHVDRDAEVVKVQIGDKPAAVCPHGVSGDRIAIGVRGSATGAGLTSIRTLAITRR
jgi:hypothetical protein